MNKKTLISIFLAILMLTSTTLACAQEAPVTLPEFISAYAARSVEFTGEYKDDYRYFVEVDGKYVASVCGSMLIANSDMEITGCITPVFCVDESSKDFDYYMYSVLSVISAIEYGHCDPLDVSYSEVQESAVDIYENIILNGTANMASLVNHEKVDAYSSEEYNYVLSVTDEYGGELQDDESRFLSIIIVPKYVYSLE